MNSFNHSLASVDQDGATYYASVTRAMSASVDEGIAVSLDYELACLEASHRAATWSPPFSLSSSAGEKCFRIGETFQTLSMTSPTQLRMQAVWEQRQQMSKELLNPARIAEAIALLPLACQDAPTSSISMPAIAARYEPVFESFRRHITDGAAPTSPVSPSGSSFSENGPMRPGSFFNPSEGIFLHVWSSPKCARRYIARSVRAHQMIFEHRLQPLSVPTVLTFSSRGAVFSLSPLLPLRGKILSEDLPQRHNNPAQNESAAAALAIALCTLVGVHQRAQRRAVMESIRATALGHYFIAGVHLIGLDVAGVSCDYSGTICPTLRPEAIVHVCAEGTDGNTDLVDPRPILKDELVPLAILAIAEAVETMGGAPKFTDCVQQGVVTKHCHANGLNMCLLWWLRQYCADAQAGVGFTPVDVVTKNVAVVQELIETEMLCRTVKDVLKGEMRAASSGVVGTDTSQGSQDNEAGSDNNLIERANRLFSYVAKGNHRVWAQLMELMREKFSTRSSEEYGGSSSSSSPPFSIPHSPKLVKILLWYAHMKVGCAYDTASQRIHRVVPVAPTTAYFSAPEAMKFASENKLDQAATSLSVLLEHATSLQPSGHNARPIEKALRCLRYAFCSFLGKSPTMAAALELLQTAERDLLPSDKQGLPPLIPPMWMRIVAVGFLSDLAGGDATATAGPTVPPGQVHPIVTAASSQHRALLDQLDTRRLTSEADFPVTCNSASQPFIAHRRKAMTGAGSLEAFLALLLHEAIPRRDERTGKRVPGDLNMVDPPARGCIVDMRFGLQLAKWALPASETTVTAPTARTALLTASALNATLSRLPTTSTLTATYVQTYRKALKTAVSFALKNSALAAKEPAIVAQYCPPSLRKATFLSVIKDVLEQHCQFALQRRPQRMAPSSDAECVMSLVQYLAVVLLDGSSTGSNAAGSGAAMITQVACFLNDVWPTERPPNDVVQSTGDLAHWTPAFFTARDIETVRDAAKTGPLSSALAQAITSMLIPQKDYVTCGLLAHALSTTAQDGNDGSSASMFLTTNGKLNDALAALRSLVAVVERAQMSLLASCDARGRMSPDHMPLTHRRWHSDPRLATIRATRLRRTLHRQAIAYLGTGMQTLEGWRRVALQIQMLEEAEAIGRAAIKKKDKSGRKSLGKQMDAHLGQAALATAECAEINARWGVVTDDATTVGDGGWAFSMLVFELEALMRASDQEGEELEFASISQGQVTEFRRLNAQAELSGALQSIESLEHDARAAAELNCNAELLTCHFEAAVAIAWIVASTAVVHDAVMPCQEMCECAVRHMAERCWLDSLADKTLHLISDGCFSHVESLTRECHGASFALSVSVEEASSREALMALQRLAWEEEVLLRVDDSASSASPFSVATSMALVAAVWIPVCVREQHERRIMCSNFLSMLLSLVEADEKRQREALSQALERAALEAATVSICSDEESARGTLQTQLREQIVTLFVHTIFGSGTGGAASPPLAPEASRGAEDDSDTPVARTGKKSKAAKKSKSSLEAAGLMSDLVIQPEQQAATQIMQEESVSRLIAVPEHQSRMQLTSAHWNIPIREMFFRGPYVGSVTHCIVDAQHQSLIQDILLPMELAARQQREMEAASSLTNFIGTQWMKADLAREVRRQEIHERTRLYESYCFGFYGGGEVAATKGRVAALRRSSLGASSTAVTEESSTRSSSVCAAPLWAGDVAPQYRKFFTEFHASARYLQIEKPFTDALAKWRRRLVFDGLAVKMHSLESRDEPHHRARVVIENASMRSAMLQDNATGFRRAMWSQHVGALLLPKCVSLESLLRRFEWVRRFHAERLGISEEQEHSQRRIILSINSSKKQLVLKEASVVIGEQQRRDAYNEQRDKFMSDTHKVFGLLLNSFTAPEKETLMSPSKRQQLKVRRDHDEVAERERLAAESAAENASTLQRVVATTVIEHPLVAFSSDVMDTTEAAAREAIVFDHSVQIDVLQAAFRDPGAVQQMSDHASARKRVEATAAAKQRAKSTRAKNTTLQAAEFWQRRKVEELYDRYWFSVKAEFKEIDAIVRGFAVSLAHPSPCNPVPVPGSFVLSTMPLCSPYVWECQREWTDAASKSSDAAAADHRRHSKRRDPPRSRATSFVGTTAGSIKGGRGGAAAAPPNRARRSSAPIIGRRRRSSSWVLATPTTEHESVFETVCHITRRLKKECTKYESSVLGFVTLSEYDARKRLAAQFNIGRATIASNERPVVTSVPLSPARRLRELPAPDVTAAVDAATSPPPTQWTRRLPPVNSLTTTITDNIGAPSATEVALQAVLDSPHLRRQREATTDFSERAEARERLAITQREGEDRLRLLRGLVLLERQALSAPFAGEVTSHDALFGSPLSAPRRRPTASTLPSKLEPVAWSGSHVKMEASSQEFTADARPKPVPFYLDARVMALRARKLAAVRQLSATELADEGGFASLHASPRRNVAGPAPAGGTGYSFSRSRSAAHLLAGSDRDPRKSPDRKDRYRLLQERRLTVLSPVAAAAALNALRSVETASTVPSEA